MFSCRLLSPFCFKGSFLFSLSSFLCRKFEGPGTRGYFALFLQCFFIFLLLYCRVALDSWVVVATSQSHRLLDSDGGVTKRRRDVVVCFDAILTNLISQLETEASMAGFEPSPPVQQLSVQPSTPLPLGFKAKLKE